MSLTKLSRTEITLVVMGALSGLVNLKCQSGLEYLGITWWKVWKAVFIIPLVMLIMWQVELLKIAKELNWTAPFPVRFAYVAGLTFFAHSIVGLTIGILTHQYLLAAYVGGYGVGLLLGVKLIEMTSKEK